MQSEKSDSKSSGIGRAGRRGRRGYVLFWFAAIVVVVLCFAGLVFDVGNLEFHKRRAQTAADAGAMGAIQEMLHGGSNSSVRTAAFDDVTFNGFTHNVAGANVVVNYPPVSGPYAGNSHNVEVIVTKNLPTTFMRVLSFTNMSVRARAVGRSGNSDYCIVSLNPHMASALNVWGNTSVDTRNCGVLVDSDNPQAMTVGGSGCIVAHEIDVVGSATGTCAAPTPHPGATYLNDPLAWLPQPEVDDCDYTNVTVNRATTLSPGTYCGGIRMVSNGYTLTLTPGLYILNGGGLDAQGGANLVGNGVTFFNTARNGQTFGPIRINGNTSFTLSAPTSGTYEGILFFQDRAITSTANDILGNNADTIDGLIYLPRGGLNFTGNSSANGYLNIVADSINFTGNSRMGNNYSSLQNGAPIQTASLVE